MKQEATLIVTFKKEVPAKDLFLMAEWIKDGDYSALFEYFNDSPHTSVKVVWGEEEK